jgi:N-methylhydantoinase A
MSAKIAQFGPAAKQEIDSMLFVGVDIGGTFTDLIAYETDSSKIESVKSLTTYDNLARGVLNCIDKADIRPENITYLFHGTTIVINTVIQRSGSKTALITTEGFRDVLEIARGNRPEPYNLLYRRSPPLVERRLRYEVIERMGSKGQIRIPLDRESLARVVNEIRKENVEAVAIAFFNSYANPAHEREAAAFVRKELPQAFVTASTDLSQELREYERTSTAVVNAYVGKMVQGYIKNQLEAKLSEQGFNGRFFVMESSGGVMTAAAAAERPALLMESGPVAGVIGSAHLGACMNLPDVVSFDMGGTTAKCCLVEAGRPAVTDLYFVGGYERGFPVQAAMLDVVEVGAGGGSIAWIDATGSLRVGPRSAGSEPGPVCYGRGGTEPTVTDANAVLGRIDPDYFLGGQMKLDAAAAQETIAKIAAQLNRDVMEIAEGIVRIANFIMAGAVRRITIERGRDPRDFAMVAQGGGGPIHAVDIARELGIRTVLVPQLPSTFSAVGMLVANVRHDYVRSMPRRLDAIDLSDLENQYRSLEQDGRARIAEEAPDAIETVFTRFADMRYKGQAHTVKVDLTGAATADAVQANFEREYTRLYGHVSEGVPIEIVSIRVAAEGRLDAPSIDKLGAERKNANGKAPPRAAGQRQVYFAEAKGFLATPVYFRDDLPAGMKLEGPAVIQEYGSTTVLHPGDALTVEGNGAMTIHVGEL